MLHHLDAGIEGFHLSVAMPRMTSTNCITGAGFIECRPMKRSVLSVDAASLVIEIDEVFVASMVLGSGRGHNPETVCVDGFVLGRSFDHEIAIRMPLRSTAERMR